MSSAPAWAPNRAKVMDFVSSHHDTYPAISPASADLSGRSVFVTGASKGCGRATAVSFAAAGCSRIAIGARSSLAATEDDMRKAAAAAGRPEPQVLSLVLDVTSEDSVRAAAAAVAREFGGRLDVLINNAGCSEDWVPLGESDPAEWWRTWEVFVKGTYLCTRYLLPLLLAPGSSRLLINITSIGAITLSPNASGYQPAKLAILKLSQHLDLEYRPQGLIVVAVHPGGVATDVGLKLPKELHHMLIDTPALCGDTLVWLARDRREWLSGRYLTVNWDVEELEARKDEIVDRDLFVPIVSV